MTIKKTTVTSAKTTISRAKQRQQRVATNSNDASNTRDTKNKRTKYQRLSIEDAFYRRSPAKAGTPTATGTQNFINEDIIAETTVIPGRPSDASNASSGRDLHLEGHLQQQAAIISC